MDASETVLSEQMKKRIVPFILGLAMCLGIILAWHLHVTRFRPWEFRPLGDLWWSEGWGRGFPIDTRANEKYLRQLRSDNPTDRAHAARRLADPGHSRYEPEIGPGLAALVGDPSAQVRAAAASGLSTHVGFRRTESADRELAVIALLAGAMLTDEDARNRLWIAHCLHAVMGSLRRHGCSDFYVAAGRVVRKYATMGLRDENVDVAYMCETLLEELDHEPRAGGKGSGNDAARSR